MPRKKEESSESEESEEEESEEGSDDEEDGSEEEDSGEGSDDEDGSEDSDEDSEEGSEGDESEDETPRSSTKKQTSKNNKSDGLLNISLIIDKENGKVVSSKVEEKPKENPLNPPVETSTTMTQTDHNMFFPPLSEALYQASTSSQKKDELINQAKKVLLAPDTAWRNMYSPQLPTYHQPVYKPISSPYSPMYDEYHQSSMRTRNNHYDYPPRNDPYSYAGSSSYKPVGPQSNHYKHYPPPPRNNQLSPSDYSSVRFLPESSSRHYYDKNTPSFKPINEMDSTSNSPSFSEDNRYGRYINPKFI